ncbi:hypothetical protein BO70DRAFT_426106 [Aspergillus heteromorphus CBS 117.55]|uniref:Telomere replication protein EST3 n=1 Tax=Aspergillus heteromorphus CBS 117.55 TaxID=1448321 RepID=A0A317WXZ2_9EURO|nr:uncharacterized protein BO70DRAFT_426106 [Aspergillus heteromorphus CBS 117.55]PWY91219.1 hypothetical protein BO70DRAFT_426106 [Aspergillus heteromorphus CBS 117.55]
MASQWIAPFLENSLSAYLQGSYGANEYEDDGSNLRFVARSQHSALINGLTELKNVLIFNLTDSTTQIEAILSQEALEEYQKFAPQHPLRKDAVRGYNVQLLSFEMVLEYSTVEPKVHLYVQRFNIAWQGGKIRAAPQGKSIKKIPALKKLMRSVFSRVKGSAMLDVNLKEEFNDSTRSSIRQDTQMPASQGILMSQMPPVIPAMNPSLPSPSTHQSGSARLLLGMLGTASETSGAPSISLKNQAVPPLFNEEAHTGGGAAGQVRSSQHSAEISRPYSLTPRGSDPGQLQPATETETIQGPVVPSSIAHDNLANGDAQQAPVVTEAEQDHLVEHVEESTSAANEKGGASLASPEQPSNKASLGARNSPEKPQSSHVDPWHGMDRIRTRDVKIPKEQAELLEQHRRRWIPPSPGESTPQGHVPPRLLDQWNKIALRRRRMAQGEEPNDAQSEPPVTHEASPSFPSPTPQTDTDSDEENLSWSESEPEQTTRSRQVLPADSSPVRVESKKAEEPSLQKNAHLPDEQSPKRPSSESARFNDDSLQSIAKGQDADVSMNVSSPGVDQPANHNDTTTLENTTHIHDAQAESDDDSVMDTSVPCPLGNNTQQVQFTSQSEQEVTSSGPSLPGQSTRDHVQVVETPDVNICRHRLAGPSKGDDLQSPTSGQVPEATKSSSQSRILNTYATKGTSSQISDPGQANRESHDVDIFGTQVGSSLSMHDTTPYSTSDMGLNSSARKDQEPSASIDGPAYQSETSNPFSSYREMPSSMSEEAQEQPLLDIESSILVSTGITTGHSLKRPASDIEHDSPAKRPRTETDQRSTETVSNMVDHGHSTANSESQKIYEKFRRDYPSYSGSFDHFAILCSKLQAVRVNGHLKRSFLWDDFVIKHLEEYPSYLEQCSSAGNKSLVYEDYFASFFSKPSYKKRSLTAHGIDISAANIPTSQTIAPVTVVSPEKPNDSFTVSLIDRLTNFHAHSFEPGTQDTQSDTDMEYISCLMSSPTPQEKGTLSITGLPLIAEQPMEVDQEQESEPDAPVDKVDPQAEEADAEAKNPTKRQTPIADPEEQPESTDSATDSEMGGLTSDQQQLRLMLRSEPRPKSDIAEDNVDVPRRGSSGDQPMPVKDEHHGSGSTDSDESYSEESDSDERPPPPTAHDQSSTVGEDSSNPRKVSTSGDQPMPVKVEHHRSSSTDSDESGSDEELPHSTAHEQTPAKGEDAGNPQNQVIENQMSESQMPESQMPESQMSESQMPESEIPESQMTESQTESKALAAYNQPQATATDLDSSIPESMPSNEPSQPKPQNLDSQSSHVTNDETHETASIELGDSTQRTDADADPPNPNPNMDIDTASESEPESDAESDNENWFDSLRHMRPSGPVWSDDPHTPFKQWARADQNVLSERYRRGGAFLSVDEKGVIRRP